MKKNLICVAAVAAILSSPVMADGHSVKSYTVNSNGTVWRNSIGECWRTNTTDSDRKLEECGYEAPKAEAKPAPAPAPAPKAMPVSITLNSEVLFGFDSAQLTAEAQSLLKSRIDQYRGKVVATEPVRVVGHTDSTGAEAYNQKLSERRAMAVAEFLKSNTVLSSNDISVVGAGESQPVADNATREGRKQNRRVDIHFVGLKK